jgi:hypothetical protein
MKKRMIVVIAALALSTIFCTTQPAGQATQTPDINAIVNATLTAMANAASPTTIPTGAPSPTVATVPATGGISGYLSYPGSFIPPLRVVAFDAVKTATYFYVDTLQNQSDYTISGLPAGVYHVVSYRVDDPTLAGGYTQMVPCGLAYGCNDHGFINVTVTAGSTTTGIDPGDWYAPAGTFPAMPTP